MDKTSVQLSWNPPRDEGARSDTSYKVDIELSSCPSCATAVTFNPSQQTSQTSMTISNLTPGVIYKLRVYASNGVSSLGNYTKIVSRKLIEKFFFIFLVNVIFNSILFVHYIFSWYQSSKKC